jgi:hypothetical protein
MEAIIQHTWFAILGCIAGCILRKRDRTAESFDEEPYSIRTDINRKFEMQFKTLNIV